MYTYGSGGQGPNRQGGIAPNFFQGVILAIPPCPPLTYGISIAEVQTVHLERTHYSSGQYAY